MGFLDDAYQTVTGDNDNNFFNGGQGSNYNVSAINGLINAYAQYYTHGLVGVDGNGKLKAGGLTSAIGEGVGEISGRNLQRKALMDANAAADEAKRARDLQLANEQKRKQLDDTQASLFAGSTRAAAESNYQFTSQLGSSNPGKDFLGFS